MGAHPCCGDNDLMRTGVKVVAVYDMVVCGLTAGLLMVAFGFGVVGLLASIVWSGDGPNGGWLFLKDLILALVMLYLMFKTHISYQLWKGAKEDNESKCRMWRIVHVIEFVVGLVVFVILSIGLIAMVEETTEVLKAVRDTTDKASTNAVPFDNDKPTDVDASEDIVKIYVAIWFVSSILGCILRGYFIWVVSAFINRTRETRMPLTDKGYVYNNFK